MLFLSRPRSRSKFESLYWHLVMKQFRKSMSSAKIRWHQIQHHVIYQILKFEIDRYYPYDTPFRTYILWSTFEPNILFLLLRNSDICLLSTPDASIQLFKISDFEKCIDFRIDVQKYLQTYYQMYSKHVD